MVVRFKVNQENPSGGGTANLGREANPFLSHQEGAKQAPESEDTIHKQCKHSSQTREWDLKTSGPTRTGDRMEECDANRNIVCPKNNLTAKPLNTRGLRYG